MLLPLEPKAICARLLPRKEIIDTELNFRVEVQQDVQIAFHSGIASNAIRYDLQTSMQWCQTNFFSIEDVKTDEKEEVSGRKWNQ
jgi:hypothetical protein